jgi:DNA polymerase
MPELKNSTVIRMTLTAWEAHVQKWRNCTRCLLHTHRQLVVLAKGRLPCDVLFIGEAPGESENILGRPFAGPAGKLLDRIIDRSLEGLPWVPRLAYTNVVACFPAEAKKSGDHRPPAAAIKACSDRLKEFLWIARPRLIVLVGDTARKHVCGVQDDENLPMTEIIHPAAILRAPQVQQEMMAKRASVILQSAVDGLGPAKGGQRA